MEAPETAAPRSIEFKARTALLAQAFRKGTQRDQKIMLDMHAYYMREFEGSRKSLHQREGIAAGIHDLIDDEVRHLLKKDPNAHRVACRKGCGHCCHIEVVITREEALLLKGYAWAEGVALDHERLHEQRDHVGRWDELPIERRRCPFLGDDNACRVYEHRPASCRKYHVLDSAEQCDTHKHKGAKVLNLVSIPAEVVTSAMLNVFDAGPMPQMLLEVL